MVLLSPLPALYRLFTPHDFCPCGCVSRDLWIVGGDVLSSYRSVREEEEKLNISSESERQQRADTQHFLNKKETGGKNVID